MKLEFRDDAPDPAARANAGVQVRFPAPNPPVPGCPMTFNGNPITDAGAPAWIAFNCGHEIQNVPGVYHDGRPNDPPSEARGLVGYIGLQAHGGENDVESFRNVRIKNLD